MNWHIFDVQSHYLFFVLFTLLCLLYCKLPQLTQMLLCVESTFRKVTSTHNIVIPYKFNAFVTFLMFRFFTCDNSESWRLALSQRLLFKNLVKSR